MFDGKPYSYDELTGYMCFTSVTIEGVTHDMWLPVMDSHNAAMLSKAYEVKTKYGSYTVDKCTMFDVNKTIMRCLTKNLAMFGLGLYIYAGEDLPEDDANQSKMSGTAKATTPAVPDSPELIKASETVNNYIKNNQIDKSFIPKAQMYLANKDLEGLNKVIAYVEACIAKEVEKKSQHRSKRWFIQIST